MYSEQCAWLLLHSFLKAGMEKNKNEKKNKRKNRTEIRIRLSKERLPQLGEDVKMFSFFLTWSLKRLVFFFFIYGVTILSPSITLTNFFFLNSLSRQNRQKVVNIEHVLFSKILPKLRSVPTTATTIVTSTILI